jgi:uncharacterized protein YihD (DUF1040 family)
VAALFTRRKTPGFYSKLQRQFRCLCDAGYWWRTHTGHLQFFSRPHGGLAPRRKKVAFCLSPRKWGWSPEPVYLVYKNGGFPEKLLVPYGELASFSPDGNKLAYITKITENYPFKRYFGGLASDIIIFDLKKNAAEKITDHPGNDGQPSWAGDKVYFLSDRDENIRLNIWEYDTKTKETRQITRYKDFDISFMNAGPKDLVYEMGGDLYIMDLASLTPKKWK